MSEENTTQAPGLVLPDDAAAADRVSATDRLLSFDAAGNPVTATASQLREYTAAGLATTQAMTTALAGKAALVPFSLEEQLVPGEFWDGRQVYVKTYSRTLPSSLSELADFTENYLITAAFDGYDVKKNQFEITHSSIPIARPYMQFVDIWMTSEGYLAFVLHKTLSEYILGGAVTITIKYTKHD